MASYCNVTLTSLNIIDKNSLIVFQWEKKNEQRNYRMVFQISALEVIGKNCLTVRKCITLRWQLIAGRF